MKKRTDKKVIALFIITGVILFIFLGIKIYFDFFRDTSVKKQIDSIEYYGYTLEKRDNDIYKDYYKELNKTLGEKDINYSDYAKLMSKLFLIDLFTLDNKITSSDIGGLQFVYTYFKEDFINIAKTTLYSTVESNIYNDRKQELPTVTNVEITNIKTSTFTYKDEQYNSYEVSLNIEYQ